MVSLSISKQACYSLISNNSIQRVYILIDLRFLVWKSFLVGTECSFKIIAGCKSEHTHARVCVRQLLQCSPGVLSLWGMEPKVKLPPFNSIKCILRCVIAIIPFYGFEKSSTFPSVILNINLQLSEVLKNGPTLCFPWTICSSLGTNSSSPCKCFHPLQTQLQNMQGFLRKTCGRTFQECLFSVSLAKHIW